MATTLATTKQADAIKQRMAEIRTELPYDMDDARMRVRELSDWKYHMKQHPLPVLAAAVGAGYLIVPAKRTSGPRVTRCESECDCQDGGHATSLPAKRGLLGGIAGAVASLAMKQAASIAAHQINHLLSKPETS